MAETQVAQPVVSIILPVYNAGGYLQECLDSLVNQTYRAIQVVAIDDGSVDGSSDLLDLYSKRDTRVQVIHKPNTGVSDTRNTGLAHAIGEYVLFVDADDYIRLDTCEILVAEAQKTKADIVVFGGKTFPQAEWADNAFAQRNRVYSRQYVVEALVDRKSVV